MEIRFEKPSADDAQILLEIQIRAFHQDALDYGVEEGGPPNYDSLDTMLEDIETALCHKIIADEKIVGGIVAFDYGEGHYHLHIIHIHPDYHGKGIGSKAMDFIVKHYPAKKWSLDTPSYAVRNQHFYEKFGFVKIGEIPESDDILLYSYERISPS